MANKNYGKILDDGTILFAPDTIDASLVAPTAGEYAAQGYLPVTYNEPVIHEGMVARFVRWEASDGRISRVYEYEDEPVPIEQPKRYSKKKFDLALAKRRIYAAFSTWAESVEVIDGTGLTVAKLLADSTWMQSDDVEFLAIKQVAEAQFGSAILAEVLAESEDNEW